MSAVIRRTSLRNNLAQPVTTAQLPQAEASATPRFRFHVSNAHQPSAQWAWLTSNVAKEDKKLCVTTNSIDGKIVASYRGIVAAEVIFGANFVRDLVAGVTDVIGGRSGTYEKEFEGARKVALDLLTKKAEALRADAILAIRFDYQVLGEKNGMLMVAASGTAVLLAKSEEERLKDEERALEDRAVYFVTIGSSEKGPFSVLQLRELIAAGRIEESSTVRVDGRDGTRALADLFRKNG